LKRARTGRKVGEWVGKTLRLGEDLIEWNGDGPLLANATLFDLLRKKERAKGFSLRGGSWGD